MAIEAPTDWAARWRAIYAARNEQQRRVRGREGDFWAGCSEMFARGIDAPDALRDLILARIEPGDSVLDVGAGSGRYSIPIAARAREVIAVEPSPGMGETLSAEAGKRGIANIRLVPSGWLDADAPAADVVLCAHVLYFTPDVEPFVRKLDVHARRTCLIVLRVDQMQANLAGLFEEIWGEPQAPEPSFIDLYNVLYQTGIAAEVSIRRGGGGPSRFATLDDAEAMATRVLSPPDEAARAKIRPYLEAHLQPTPDGGFAFPRGGPRAALISWGRG
jgi:SAM-dependent methyltransferase